MDANSKRARELISEVSTIEKVHPGLVAAWKGFVAAAERAAKGNHEHNEKPLDCCKLETEGNSFCTFKIVESTAFVRLRFDCTSGILEYGIVTPKDDLRGLVNVLESDKNKPKLHVRFDEQGRLLPGALPGDGEFKIDEPYIFCLIHLTAVKRLMDCLPAAGVELLNLNAPSA